MTADELQRWCLSAQPGQRIEYYRGWWPKNAALPEFREIIAESWVSGLYDLAQQRHGFCDYSYFLVRRARKDPGYRAWQRSPESDLQSLERRERVRHRRPSLEAV